MSKRQVDLCVRVVAESGAHSGDWRFVVPEGTSDVYCMSKGGNGAFKFSLHENGRCRIAFSKEYVTKLRTSGLADITKRCADEWSLKDNAGEHLAIPLRLIFSPSELISIPESFLSRAKIVILPAPEMGSLGEIMLVVARREIAERMRVSDDEKAICFCDTMLSNGSRLLLVYAIQVDNGKLTEARNELSRRLPGSSVVPLTKERKFPAKHLRAIAAASLSDSCRIWVEFNLQSLVKNAEFLNLQRSRE